MFISRFKHFWKGGFSGSIPRNEHPRSSISDGDEAVILVVGNDTEYKFHVACALAEARGATKYETTKAGVGVFTRESKELFPPPVVMDTVALRTAEKWRAVDIAKVWITQNSLRKLYGKLVFVVCVIAPTSSVHQQPDVERNSFSWLSVVACIFEKHKQEIMILVNSDEDVDEASRKKLRDVLRRDGFTKTQNIIFASLRQGSDVIHSFHRGIADDEAFTKTRSAVASFRLPEVAPNASDKGNFGPWGPENLILFGRSGSGKSTLAQMLALGRLDALSQKFSTMRGETRMVNEAQGRGWRVINTPGLRELNDDAKSIISTDTALRLIFDHVLLIDGTHCHFLYVWKKSRLEDFDTRLWSIFVRVVGEDLMKDHSTVVVSDADEDWLDENLTHLKKCFQGCESFVTAEFPPIAAGDDEFEKLLQEIRLESLKALEDELAYLIRIDTGCKSGVWSKGTQRRRMVRWVESASIARRALHQSSAFGPSATEEEHPYRYKASSSSHINLKRVLSGMASVLLTSRKLDKLSDDFVSFTTSARRIDAESGSTDDPLEGKKEAKLAITSPRVLEPVTNAPDTPGTLSGTPDKVKDDLNCKERAKAVEHQEASENDPDPVVGTPKCASGIVYSAEDFRREIEEGGEDGYFVSSDWLLNLEGHERENLMSVLWGAGYSETRQTSTTTLFTRIVNERQNQVPYIGEARSGTNIHEVGSPEGGDDLFGTGRQGLNVDNVCGADHPAETSSSIYPGSRTFEDEITEEMSPVSGEQRAASWSKSFQAALESKGHQSFYVNTEWLSKLKDREMEALEAGYEKIRETKHTTWYEKIRSHLKSPTGEGTGDNDSSKSSNGNEITGGALKKPATSESGAFLERMQISDDEDSLRGSSYVKNTMETRRIQDVHSTCHPQLLSVKLCSSTSQSSMDLPAAVGNRKQQLGDTIVEMPETDRKQQLGDTIVEMPETDGSQIISTRIERPFKLKAMTFDGGHHREVRINLKAIASTTLSCCIRADHHQAKVRFKISRISGEVKNEELSSEEDEEEELCHEMVLSSLYTTVYGYMKSPTDSKIPSGQIILNLEDEYWRHPRRRVLAKAEQSQGDLLWLEMSGTSTNSSHSGSTALVLQADINGRRKDEAKRQVQQAEPLLFQEPRPVIVEGDIQEYHPNSFLEFHITHKLQYSYFKICRGRVYREEGPVWPIRHDTKAIDFGYCLEMSTKGLWTQNSTPM